MKTPAKLNALILFMVCLMLIYVGGSGVYAAAVSNAGVSPGTATSNSMFEFYCTYSDNPDNAPASYPLKAELYIDDMDNPVKVWSQSQLAAFDVDHTIRSGMKIVFRMSAGLNLSDMGFGPNSLFTDSLQRYDWKKVYWAEKLVAASDGGPKTHNWRLRIVYQPPAVNGVLPDPINMDNNGTVTVHDSFRWSNNPRVTRYGGQAGDWDTLHNFPENYPMSDLNTNPDPLNVTPYEVQFPDEGTSTSTYTFRTRYQNDQGLPARPWMLEGQDSWNTAAGAPDHYESGVMLYMRNLDRPSDPYWGQFQGHVMYKVDPAQGNNGHYILNVLPIAGIIGSGSGNSTWKTTWAWTSATNHWYEALPPGRYEYYFACSDDDFSAFALDDDKNRVWPYLDPSPADPTSPPPNDRLFGPMGINFDTNSGRGYVDKRTYMPGAWNYGYPYDSWMGSTQNGNEGYMNLSGRTIYNRAYTFPQVDPGLYEVGGTGHPVGLTRFLGTLTPYKRAVIPELPTGDPINPYVSDFGASRLWAETSGGTDKDRYTFRITYWQSPTATDCGDLPSYVRLYVKNSWNPEDTTVPWKSWDMNIDPVFNSGTLDYKTGVVYYKELGLSELGYGPHCYYFQAADKSWVDARYAADHGITMMVGSKVVRYPRRPDTIDYDGRTFSDGVLPARKVDETTGLPMENDVINGPYINRRPIIVPNSWSVSPTTGSSGKEFVYKVTYLDPDNQRPYTPYLIIETDDQGHTARVSMVRSPESSVPGNSTKRYDQGVTYEFRTSSAPGLILQPGQRHYRFEFTDDWGRPTNVDDRIQGETVYEPQNGAGWLPGPIVSANTPPRLSLGSVVSADGTSNSATTWNYTVTYTDADNDKPAYIAVFIGRQDTPDGPIVWDSGNAMTEVNPTDTVYSHGKAYQFSTRLPGDNTNPIKYYHCFIASDGIDTADYDATLSPSSGMVWRTAQTLTGTSSVYDFGHKPLVAGIPPASPGVAWSTSYTEPLIWGTVGGVEQLLTSGADYTLDAEEGKVTISSAAEPIKAKYWFGTEPDPEYGPNAVTGNHAPTLQTGQVIPLSGTSSTMFTYTVQYKDLDGQAPQFMHVVIDGVAYDMVKKVTGATTYKNGVDYQYQTTLTTGTHQFYFETSDGADLVIFDADQSNTTLDPIVGPYVNDRPTLTAAQITPSGTVDQGQPITYSVIVTDKDNDAPLQGYPVVYIDNPTETDWSGSLTAAPVDNMVKDSTQNWTPGQFNGMPVVIGTLDQSGNTNPIVYKIDHNTANELYLVATADELSGIPQGSPYSIGKIVMQKVDPNDMIFADGVAYEAKVPSLGVGLHKAHFKAIVHEQTQPGQFTDTTLRAPTSGDLSGPTVQSVAPIGNVPPVLANGSVTPHTGTAATPFRFAVTYSDANGNSPIEAHDGVTGYIRMQIEETPGNWVTYNLTTDPTVAHNYSVGVEFSTNISGLQLGPHNFFFEASDGWTTARLPSSGFQTVYVSRPPTLVEGEVTPVSGNTGQVFEYKVKYKDPDNDPPAYIKLVVDGGTPIDIGVPIPGADYISGVVYSYPSLKNSLTEGVHNFYFIASDGNGYAWYDQDVRDQETAHDPDPHKNNDVENPPSAIVPIDGPSVHSNTAPRLLNGSVTPGNGFDLDTYTYRVTYQDPDGDQPEYVECYIDDPDPLNPNAQRAYKMTKDPNSNDFVAGVAYTLSKTGLAPGTHTFYFKASDWMSTAYFPADGSGNPQAPISGPTVSTRGTATVNLTVPTSITIGSTATVTGSVLGYGGVPIPGASVTLTITKPDGSVIAPAPTVMTNASGQFTYPESPTTWKPSVTGTWKVQATTLANSTQYLPSTSQEKAMSVVGPSFTVNGLDMISLPMRPLSTFPDGALGSVPGFALAKWSPSKMDYLMYSLLPGVGRTDLGFTGIQPGQAYWIKTLVPKTIAPTGNLVDTSSDYTVTLGVGWNQVGYPFTTECQWGDLMVRRTVNGVTQETTLAAAAANGWLKEYGWTYDPSTGNYKLVDAVRTGAERTMRPWRGYWMKANMYCTIVIPAPVRKASASPAVKALSVADNASAGLSEAAWQVRMIARNGDLKDEFNYFGESRGKEDRVESPGCFQNYVDLFFTGKNGGEYASELLSRVGLGSEWQFTVETDTVGEVELTWDGLDSVPSEYHLVLVDEDGKSTDIVPGGSYKFAAEKGAMSKSFRIEVRKSGSSETGKR